MAVNQVKAFVNGASAKPGEKNFVDEGWFCEGTRDLVNGQPFRKGWVPFLAENMDVVLPGQAATDLVGIAFGSAGNDEISHQDGNLKFSRGRPAIFFWHGKDPDEYGCGLG